MILSLGGVLWSCWKYTKMSSLCYEIILHTAVMVEELLNIACIQPKQIEYLAAMRQTINITGPPDPLILHRPPRKHPLHIPLNLPASSPIIHSNRYNIPPLHIPHLLQTNLLLPKPKRRLQIPLIPNPPQYLITLQIVTIRKIVPLKYEIQ
jgi:hypothetical protein